MEQLGVASTGLALTASPKIAASRDEQPSEDGDKDGGEASRERCPVVVNEAETVIGLVEADIRGFVGLVRLNMERGLV